MDFRVIECLHSFTKEDVCVLLPNGQSCTFFAVIWTIYSFAERKEGKSHFAAGTDLVNAKTRASGAALCLFWYCGTNDTFGVTKTSHFSSKSVCTTSLVCRFTCCFALEMFIFFLSGRLMDWMGKVESGRNVVNICKELASNSRKTVIWGNTLFRRWFFGKQTLKTGPKRLLTVLCREVSFSMDYLEKVKIWHKEGRWIGTRGQIPSSLK